MNMCVVCVVFGVVMNTKPMFPCVHVSLSRELRVFVSLLRDFIVLCFILSWLHFSFLTVLICHGIFAFSKFSIFMLSSI